MVRIFDIIFFRTKLNGWRGILMSRDFSTMSLSIEFFNLSRRFTKKLPLLAEEAQSFITKPRGIEAKIFMPDYQELSQCIFAIKMML